jgi:phage repressor protein C with HTH and peptisase S24 domain
MSDAAEKPIYAKLMKVKPAELRLGTWAVRAGIARNAFNDIRRHGNPKRETLEKLLEAVGVSMAQFEAIDAPILSEVAGSGIKDVRRAYHGETPLPQLPLRGSAMGAADEDLGEDVELTELHVDEVLDWLPRPAALALDGDAYALTVMNDSMAPRYEQGEVVGISPRAPVLVGDYVIVYLRRPEADDERIHMVLIKRLVRRGADFVELEQFNPAKRFTIPKRRIARMHKVRVLLP